MCVVYRRRMRCSEGCPARKTYTRKKRQSPSRSKSFCCSACELCNLVLTPLECAESACEANHSRIHARLCGTHTQATRLGHRRARISDPIQNCREHRARIRELIPDTTHACGDAHAQSTQTCSNLAITRNREKRGSSSGVGLGNDFFTLCQFTTRGFRHRHNTNAPMHVATHPQASDRPRRQGAAMTGGRHTTQRVLQALNNTRPNRQTNASLR
jgi:hypothetical protein